MRTARPYLLTVALLWVLPLIGMVLLYAVLPHENPDGTCTGIGFGCRLSPADSAMVAGMLAAPVLGLAGVVTLIVIAASRGRRRRALQEHVVR